MKKILMFLMAFCLMMPVMNAQNSKAAYFVVKV